MNDTTNRDPQGTRERILDAALNIFSNKGYHDSRLDEIVDESQTSKGAIYFHFPNKERLFIALVDQFADLLERRVKVAIEAEPAGMGRVRVALEETLATFSRYRRPAKLMLVQAVGLGTTFESKRLEVNDRFSQMIADYLQEAIEVGDIAVVDTEVVSVAWMGAIYNVIIRWVYTGEPDSQRILDGMLPLLLQSVGYDGR